MGSPFKVFSQTFFFIFSWAFLLSSSYADTADILNATNLGKINVTNAGLIEGEHIDLRTGTFYWETTDLVIPGNGKLDIAVSRSFNKTAIPPLLDIVNWQLEVPRIIVAVEGHPAGSGELQSYSWKFTNPYTWKGSLCDSPFSTMFGFLWPGGFWSGLQLVIPGEPARELFFQLKDASQFPEITRYATADNWIVECKTSDELKTILQNVDEPFRKVHQYDKDVFLVTAPDGRRFWLDKVERQHGVWRSRGLLSPSWLIIRASMVEDLHGNRLQYHYHTFQRDALHPASWGNENKDTLHRLEKITASDGRTVEFFYDNATGLFLEKMVSDSRAWQYQYQSTEGLVKVIRPDGHAWQYQNQGLRLFNSYGNLVAPRHLTHVETPTGATIDYMAQFISAGHFVGAKSIYQIPALAGRTVKGPHLKEASWGYQFSGQGGFTITTIHGPEHKEVHEFYRTADWKLGLPYSRSLYNHGSSTPIRKEIYEWASSPPFGDSSIPRQGYTFLNQGIHKNLVKTTIDGKYQTEYQDYDVYGNPKKVVETGTESRTTERTVFNKTSSELWLIGLPKDERVEEGGTILRDYDERGNLIKLTEYGITTQFEYHPTGDLKTKIWNKGGQDESITYEDYHRGQPQTIIQPEGVILKKKINDTGTVAEEEDGEGHHTAYEYDALNRLTKIIPPIQEPTTIEWKNPRLKTLTRGAYQETTTLDALERPIQIEKADIHSSPHIITQTEYDALSRVIFQSEPSEESNRSIGIKTTYDALNRPLKIVHTGDNSETTYRYDVNQTTITHPNGYKTLLQYRIFGEPNHKELIEQKDHITKSPETWKATSLTRDKLGNITSIKQGRVTRILQYEKDRPKLLQKRYDPEVGWTHYAYDAIGNKISQGIEDQEPIHYRYDGLNRLTKIDYPKQTTSVIYHYDKNNNLTRLKKEPTEWHYRYNEVNQPLEETLKVNDATFSFSYTYDAEGHLESLTYPTGLTLDYHPDAFGRPTQMGGMVKDIEYYPNGQLKVFYTKNDLTTKFFQNKRLWPEKILTQKNGESLIEQRYRYDEQGNVTHIQRQSDTQTLTYDGISQLIQAKGPWGEGSFQYDEGGNLTKKTIGQDVLDYHYSEENKLKEVTGSQALNFVYDTKGNLTVRGDRVFAFDEASHLTALLSENPKVLYRYDGNNHRTLIQQGEEATFTLHNPQGNLLVEHTPQKQTSYIYLNDQLVARVDRQNGINRTVYFHTDILGSPIAQSDNQGKIAWQQEYKPYGERLEKGGKDNHQWYMGKTEDTETGFIYLNARYYDPQIARFISLDPVHFTESNTQSFNRYTYANNNPYTYKDPQGTFAETLWDLTSLSFSITQFIQNPSWGNFGAAAFDSIATAVPFMPGGMGIAKAAGQKSIIIGENMKRVNQYADKTGGHAYRPWKNDPFDFDLGMKKNDRWIRDQMRNGREVIDIGPDFKRRSATGKSSPFYEMERRNLNRYDNYNKVFERNGSQGGVQGLDF
ncbi:MAG: RHS domain-containing protein [Gammaproteobacteria bacterium]|nr:RHS domain-containing protein [Gammaproteobacteria bacterium]